MLARWIVIEGLEGAGKTTVREGIAAYLQTHLAKDQLVFTREPGGTPVAERLRDLVKHGVEGEDIHSTSELLMFYAARVQLMHNVVIPALNRGAWVLQDRGDLSSQAYQGAGRGLRETTEALRDLVLTDRQPDLTLYLDIDPRMGLQRARARGELDRIEQMDLSFFVKARERYLEETRTNPSCVLIDASQAREDVLKAVLDTLQQHFFANPDIAA